MFFRRTKPSVPIEAGQSFLRRRNDDFVEVARVLGVSPDSFGIPHVRYELTVEKPQSHGIYIAGTKVLSVSAFAATYSAAPA